MITTKKGFTASASLRFLLVLAVVVAGVIYYTNTLEDPIISSPNVIIQKHNKEQPKKCEKDVDCDDEEACTMDTCNAETLECEYSVVESEECEEKIENKKHQLENLEADEGGEEEDDDHDDEDIDDVVVNTNNDDDVTADADDDVAANDDNTADADDVAADVGVDCPSDGNPCTDDLVLGGVCKHVANTAGCDDGNICTNGDTCDGGVCKGHEKCGAGTYCDADTGNCENIENCTPDCSGKTCGDNGCGGSCGTCAADQTCNSGNCIAPLACEADCSGKSCGNDGCGGSCGTCSAGKACAAGVCIDIAIPGPDDAFMPDGVVIPDGVLCIPDCDGKSCGNDGCGGSCGECSLGKICNDGSCEFVILDPVQPVDPVQPIDPIQPIDPVQPINPI